MTPYQVNVAAEAWASMAMSQAGYDVGLQYGTMQPDWDILATKSPRTLKLQVKGTQGTGWGLFQGHLQNANYHGALNAWLAKQQPDVIFFLVLFMGIPVASAPRCYLARPNEIVAHMQTIRAGNGYTTLYEKHTYTRGIGKGHTDAIPAHWLASQQRIDTV